MGYVKIRFGRDIGELDSRIEKVFEDMYRSMNPMFPICEHAWTPQVDIIETVDRIIVLAEIAGVRKDDVEVEINSKAIRIFGHRTDMVHVKDAKYRLAEIQCGTFDRVLYFPTPIDPEIANASFQNGLLRVELAKQPMDKPQRVSISE